MNPLLERLWEPTRESSGQVAAHNTFLDLLWVAPCPSHAVQVMKKKTIMRNTLIKISMYNLC